MDRTTVLERNPDVVARDLADGAGAVLLNLETGAYHGLNPTGLVTWNALERRSTVGEVAAAVRVAIPDAPPSLEADVQAFLQGALQRDLIRESAPA
jgi:hypothetical protein